MSGPSLRLSSSAAAAVAAVVVMLSAIPAAQAQTAPRAHHRMHVAEIHRSVQPSSRAQYRADFPNAVAPANECVGGYRYLDHIDDANRTPGEDEIPLACH